MQIHCVCANLNFCAACLKPLYECKLNANYFNPSDCGVWHVPGFLALAHHCSDYRNANQRKDENRDFSPFVTVHLRG
jgi:hypothetical protein